ncbi:MAG: flavin reductase family protein [Dehalococcoidia bacterium]|nr:MAG: flavin reductase family protein [Dehalococcoidia bacterium]
MEKVKMGAQPFVFPMPAFLIGANVEKRANFMTAAWAGIACGEPPMISVALRHSRYTLKGVEQNMTFSVNVPSVDQAKEVDYCGIVTGAKVDKAAVCKFEVFYGELETAPMIKQCPVNLECKVEHVLDLGSHVLIIGLIKEVFVSGNCFTADKPDVKKIRPLLWTTLPANVYQGLGDVVAKAFKVGLELK